MIKRKTTVTIKPARKSRTKPRKPKFLSLDLDPSPENTQQSGEMTKTTHQQLNLFPLHPENLVQDKDTTTDDNMPYFFASADSGATTLNTLLGSRTSPEEDNSHSTQSPSLTYAYGGQDSEEGALVRTAMRNRERDASEEKWVFYSEVVERKDEEVTSYAADLRCNTQTQGLALKLDYQEILNAWSDKSPLYIKLEAPQTVPDLQDDFLADENSKGLKDSWASHGGLWTVPEKSISRGNTKVKEEVVQGGEEWKVGQRLASVLRYKEKRQNRLFSKRIRYEVRKIIAQKRPRMKGRFVKRG